MSNWCGWEWSFKFTTLRDKLKNLPFVDKNKLEKLYYDIETKACNPHDDKFEEWGWLTDFLRANKEFWIDVIRMLHWTTILGRLTTFLLLFLWTTLLGWKFFNWTRIF